VISVRVVGVAPVAEFDSSRGRRRLGEMLGAPISPFAARQTTSAERCARPQPVELPKRATGLLGFGEMGRQL